MAFTNKSKPLIFIAGNSRSGTTLMGRILGLNSKVHTFQELHFFEQLWTEEDESKIITREKSVSLLSRLLNIERNGYFTKINDKEFCDEAEKINAASTTLGQSPASIYYTFLHYETALRNKKIPCKQTPQNVFYLKEILNLFPNSKIIIMVRDPKDVLISQKNKWKRRNLGASAIPVSEAIRARFNYHPITISKLWNSAIGAGEQRLSDDRVREVHYEHLIENPEQTIRELCNFTKIPFEAEMLNVPHKGSSTAADTASAGIKKDNKDKWKNEDISEAELYICQEITKKQRARLGYADVKLKHSAAVYFWKAYWPVSIGFSLLFNLHRMKNIVSTIRKRIA